MKIVNRNAKANLILSRFVFTVMIIFLYSCGNGGSGDDSSGTGSVSFGLALQDSGTIRALNNRQLEENNSQFECQTADYEIATIEAQVVDENENLLAKGAFDCEDRRGDISNVEAGDNRKAKVFAKDSDGVTIFAGESGPFFVVGGEVTDAGLITLLPVDDALPPFPPAGLTATPGIGQITLNWLPVADATTYNVYFAGSAGVSKTNFEGVIRGVVQTSFNHSNLPGGDTFFYVVTAQNDIGESVESTEVSATVQIPPPEGLTATPGIGQITLNWLPVADATTYNVYFARSAGVSKTNFEGVFRGVVPTSFTHPNLPGGISFFYVVTAQNDIGESVESTEVSATVLILPLPPAGVTATPGIGQITLNWLSVADATTYNVYFARSAGVSKTNFEGVFRGVVQTSFNHSNLPGGDTFFYVVTAQNDIGESDESTEVSATVLSVNARLVDEFIGTGFGSDPWTGLFNTGFDGSGGGDFNDIATSDGILENGTMTYNLDIDGSLTSTLSDETVFDGILNANNNILAVADTDFSDAFIEMDVVIKKSTGLTNAILNGEYIGVRISNFRSTALTSTIFDGNGNGTFQILTASDGFLDTDTFTYSVNPDNGGVTIFLPGGAVASQGIMSGEGTVVSIVDTNASDDDEISMAVLIKMGSGLSNASLNGDYVGVSFSYFIGEGFDEQTATMSINADGAGNMVFETLSNSSGIFGTFNATYNVNPNGRITIDLPNEETFEGIVIGEGDILNFVNTDPSDQFIEMGVAIKKTQ